MLARAKLMAFAATTDGVAARRFYEGVLGLNVLADDDFALALDAAGTTLRIQKVQQLAPPAFTALGWQVSNIVESVDDLSARGVLFEKYTGLNQDARGIWRSPSGARVAWFKDPDGNTLSLTEL